jgi:hypothetical protein
MEHLFSPCTRLHDILQSQSFLSRARRRHPLLPELNLDVSTEDFLSAERAFTYADLYAMLGNEDTVAWLTPHAAVARGNGIVKYAWQQLRESYRFFFIADGNKLVVVARSPEYLLEICDIVLQLLAASVVHSLLLSKWSSPNELIITPTLSYLMEQCQSLKVLKLMKIEIDENHCRVLGDFSRPDLEIALYGCKITSAGASALVEVLRRNQGPTKLVECAIDNLVLADGLRGNSRLRSLRPLLSNSTDDGNREVLAIAVGLRQNRGLDELDMSIGWVTDETWSSVCDSLKTHLTLGVMDLRRTVTDPIGTTAPAVLISRMQALVDMMTVNISIHTIHLDEGYSEHDRGSLNPYLETNRLRPRLLAIQQTRPIAYRAKVLGRALLAVRSDPNRFWMLLSGNAEVAFL